MRELRLIDQAGQLVRVLMEDEADELSRSGKATLRKTGRREVMVLASSLTVRDFQRGSDEDPASPALVTTYQETHGGRKVIQLKRPTKSGELAKWDNELTFDELRAGRMMSEAKRLRIIAAEYARTNLIETLANQERLAA